MAFCWRADDGPTLNAVLVAEIFRGIRTCIARKPYICDFSGGGGGGGPSLSHPPPPPLAMTFSKSLLLSRTWHLIRSICLTGDQDFFTLKLNCKLSSDIACESSALQMSSADVSIIFFKKWRKMILSDLIPNCCNPDLFSLHYFWGKNGRQQKSMQS